MEREREGRLTSMTKVDFQGGFSTHHLSGQDIASLMETVCHSREQVKTLCRILKESSTYGHNIV